jgi:hypothetical protein
MAYTSASLPHHVHEDGDDQSRLQHHEREYQEPSEVALNVEIVDGVRGGGKNEQQPPDLEIDAEWMVLPHLVVGRRRHGVRPR